MKQLYYMTPEDREKKEAEFEERRKAEFAQNGPNKMQNVDFLGRPLEPGDFVVFRQRYFEPFGYGTIVEESEWPYGGSVMVHILNRGPKEKEKRPYKGSQLIKISKEEIMLKTLEGSSKFLREYRNKYD